MKINSNKPTVNPTMENSSRKTETIRRPRDMTRRPIMARMWRINQGRKKDLLFLLAPDKRRMLESRKMTDVRILPIRNPVS